ncbi:MAG: helix-turn-helix domain-containing protein [Desulfurellaceae bacterium]|nr:helix-turn-helix domain-containing protein [Desulfurellaceae bacterium]
MNKALPVITESPQQLQRRVRAEPEARKRQRLQALYLLASGQAASRVALAALLAVHRHTIRAWLTQYEAGGLRALLTIKTAPGKRSTLPPAVLAHLHQRLAQPRGFTSYGEIQRYLAQEHHVHLCYSTVHGLVRYKLGAKPKAPRRAHPKKTLLRSPASAGP